MDFKTLFEKAENGTLTYEQFQSAITENKMNLVDLSEGNYVSKSKHDDELGKLTNQINTLNGTIASRDTDLAELQKKISEAGNDKALKTAQKELEALQSKYDEETKAYQKKLSDQAYEFAVRDFASSKKFTSNAAKRDFVNSMIAKNLTLENGVIIGASEFVDAYSKDNADAFQTEVAETTPEKPKPMFVAPTENGNQYKEDPTGGFANAFHFTPIHPQSN